MFRLRFCYLFTLFCVYHIFFVSAVSPRYQTPSGAGLSHECVNDPNNYNCSKDGRCIPRAWLCDGDDDCLDGEDEHNCSHKSCPPGHFMCEKSKKCVIIEWFCDQEADCEDFSDEMHPNCSILSPPKPCRLDQFQCPKSHLCISRFKLCDKIKDCPHGEDEICHTNNSHSTAPVDTQTELLNRCTPDEFQCANGRCINKTWFCDDDDDCSDGSDELHILCNATCTHDEFHCVTGRPRRCIPSRWRCDGDLDCSDGSDEQNCSAYNHTLPCRPFEHRCANGQCITRAFVCDGDYDCVDKSDEGVKGGCDPKCSSNQFLCTETRFCIDLSKRCNGDKDCADNSDELSCSPTSVHHCLAHEFYCGFGDNKCINRSKVCDGIRDCPSGSDEEDDLGGNCSRVNLGPVCDPKANSNNCGEFALCMSVAKKEGRCECIPGYRNNATMGRDEALQCLDINECSSDAHMCTQGCLNTKGSYHCYCHQGYILTEDKRTCIAHGPPRLWVTSKDHIKLVTIPRNERPVGAHFVANLSFAVAMDYHYSRNLIAYSDIDRKAIFICEIGAINHSQPTHVKASLCERQLISENISEPNGIAIDWVHDLLYWTDAHTDKIRVVSLETPDFHRTLISENLDEPRAIVVEPMKGLMFWTDWGKAPKIERAAMDGSSRLVLVNNDQLARWPNGLAVDMLNERLYFADAKLKHIVSMDYSGRQVKFVLKSWRELEHPFGLSVFEDRVYWSDWESSGVHYANKFDGSSPTVVARYISGSTSIRVYHEQVQPAAPNKCLEKGCPHLCVPSITLDQLSGLPARTYTCLCADGYENRSIECVRIGDSNSSVAKFIDESTSTVGFMTSLLLLMVACLICLAVLMWQKRRRAELRRWTFGQHTSVYASRHPDVVMDDVRHGVMIDGVDASTPSFDDHLRLSFDRDAVYRPTTVSSSLAPNGMMTSSQEVGDENGSMTSSSMTSIRSGIDGASSAVARLVRRLTSNGAQILTSVTGRRGDILHVPLTEHMENEPVT